MINVIKMDDMPTNRGKNNKTKVVIFVGTRKGGFIFTSDPDRKAWEVSNLIFKGWRVMHIILDPRDRRLHAALAHDVYGPSTHYSDDLGKSWTQAEVVPAFTLSSRSGRPLGTPDEAQTEMTHSKPENVIKVWNITPGRVSESNILYAGVEPAALFKSEDRGQTWMINESLFDHPHRAEWFPGAGGLCLHTILLDPLDPNRPYVAISTGGCYRTDDGGKTWQPRNKNVRADFLPNKLPEYGQCIHKIAMHPNQPDVLFQQNHCGVYRSDNRGDDWVDIGEGKLPSRFGFPIAVHPHDPATIYVVLEESDEYRLSVDGKFALWRSHNKGESWDRLANGLPGNAHLVVLREALTTDSLDKAGVYVGTNTGQIFYSRDEGDHWEVLADYLPSILSVEAALID